MARRSRRKNNLPLILGGVFGLAALAAGGAVLLGKRGAPAIEAKDLDVSQYIDSNSSLRGNRYRIVGRIDDRLDKNWPASQGRIFGLSVTRGSDRELVPVLVPSSLNDISIDRGVEYIFVIKVDDDGVLVAENVSPS